MALARVLLLAATAACSLAVPLSAQRITSPYRYIEPRQYVSIFGGSLSTQTGGAGLGPTSGHIFGGQFGFRLSGPFVIEATIGYAPLKRVARDTIHSAADTTVFRAVGSSATQGVLLAAAALRFDLTGARTWYGLQPYLLLGGGGAINTSGENGGDSLVPADARFSFGTSFAAQAGGGFEWYATRHIGLRFDARGTLWKLHTPQAFLIRDPTLPQSEWAQNVSLVGGLALHF
jgi:hypothetical protein